MSAPGVGNVGGAFERAGHRVRYYDCIRESTMENMMLCEGMLTALAFAFEMAEGESVAHLATVCSSWIFTSRGTTKRNIYKLQ